MRLKNIKKIRGKNAVDTSYGLNGCAECKARISLQGARNFQQVARIFGEIGNESMVAQSYNLSDLILSKITLIVPRKLVVTILSCVNFIQKLTFVSLLKLNFKSK